MFLIDMHFAIIYLNMRISSLNERKKKCNCNVVRLNDEFLSWYIYFLLFL